MPRNFFYGLALLLAGCAQNPATGNIDFVLMSEYEEMRIGNAGNAEIKQQYGVYPNPALQRYVDEVGQKLAKNSHRNAIPYHFTVLDTADINAFAIPGGHVYITRGMLAFLNSEAELAATLGHEIGHITARHAVREYSSSAALAVSSVLIPGMGTDIGKNLVEKLNNVITMGYSREHELEADRLGAEYLLRSDYDPQAMAKVIGVLKNEEAFDAEIAKREGRAVHAYHGVYASHPDNETRVEKLAGETRRLVKTSQHDTIAEQAAFLARLNGLNFGKDVRYGVVVDSSFYHAGHGIALEFPSQWRTAVLPDVFVAQSPDRQALLTLNQLNIHSGTAPDLLRRVLHLDDETALQPTSINGLSAAVATTDGDSAAKLAVIKPAPDKALVAAIRTTSPEAFQRYLGEIDHAINSLHPLTPEESRRAKTKAINIITAAPGLTFAELARNSALGDNAVGILRLLNGIYPDGEPTPGSPLKVIE